MAVPTKVFIPLEILIELLPFLDIKDLKSFRSCNKLLATEGARLLFHTLIMFLRHDSFDHLTNIASHQNFRHHVKRIYYVANQYPPELSMDQWRHHYGRGQRDQLNAVVWLQKPYKAYRELADEQQELLRDGEHIKTWAYALERFSNLDDFRVLLREARKPNHGLLRPTMSRTFVEPDINTDFEYIFPALPTLAEWTDSPLLLPRPNLNLPILHTLHLEGLDPRRFAELIEHWQRKAACGAPFTFLCGLRDLRVDLVSPKTYNLLYSMGALALRNFLVVAKNIVKLRLSFLAPEGQPWFIHIFPDDYIWPDLQHVELDGFVFSTEALAAFIDGHQATLRRLIFRNPSSIGSAGEAFDALLSEGDLHQHGFGGVLGRAFASAAIQPEVEGDSELIIATWKEHNHH